MERALSPAAVPWETPRPQQSSLICGMFCLAQRIKAGAQAKQKVKLQDGIVQKKGTFTEVDLLKKREVDVLFSHRHLKFQEDFN